MEQYLSLIKIITFTILSFYFFDIIIILTFFFTVAPFDFNAFITIFDYLTSNKFSIINLPNMNINLVILFFIFYMPSQFILIKAKEANTNLLNFF